MDAKTLAWLDQEDARVTDLIRRFGCAITYVGSGDCSMPGCACQSDVGPPFAYTTGLFGLGHPELLVFGLDPETACSLLNHLHQGVRNGEALIEGMEIDFEDWPHRVIPEPVPNPGEIVFEANRFYRKDPRDSVPVLQLSYDDNHGKFPWEDGCMAAEMQPRPGTFRA